MLGCVTNGCVFLARPIRQHFEAKNFKQNMPTEDRDLDMEEEDKSPPPLTETDINILKTYVLIGRLGILNCLGKRAIHNTNKKC